MPVKFASCTIPDGFFGDRRRAELAFYRGIILVVLENGSYFREPYFQGGILDIQEAIWLVKNHPKFRPYVKNLEVYNVDNIRQNNA